MAGRFTGCIGAIVAAEAVSADTRVIDTRCLPANGVVAEITLRGGLHVRCMFASCNAAVVTGRATAFHFIVIHPCHRRPQCRGMAGFTPGAGLNMRAVFAGGADAIVAGATAAIDCGVIDGSHWGPGRRAMAQFTDIIGQYMLAALALCIDIIMTTDTGAGHG